MMSDMLPKSSHTRHVIGLTFKLMTGDGEQLRFFDVLITLSHFLDV